MATTYGYGGEFSSDEDIDRMEQQSERLVQSKFDAYAQVKPTKHQIEEAIEAIRLLPLDQDINIKDELLAGLLDHYKTQRGPIVDSTRNLYKKIILRLVRGEQVQQTGDNGDSLKGTNGTVYNVRPPVAKPLQAPETISSDEDEPMLPVSSQASEGAKSKFDSRVVYDNKLEPMEVDSETPLARALGIRTVKPVDISTTESESSSDSETESSGENSDSEVTDVTPTKPSQVVLQKPRTTTAVSKTSKQHIELPKKQAPVIKSSADVEKPYTRSRRVATRASSSSTYKEEKRTDVSSSKVNTVSSASVKPVSKSSLKSKLKGGFLISIFLILVALVLYNKKDLSKLRETIKF